MYYLSAWSIGGTYAEYEKRQSVTHSDLDLLIERQRKLLRAGYSVRISVIADNAEVVQFNNTGV